MAFFLQLVNAKATSLSEPDHTQPFNPLILQVVMQYSNAQVVWCQEEPKNMGAWRYIKPRMDTAMRELVKNQEGSSMPPTRIRYVGRPAAASPGAPPAHGLLVTL